MELTFAGLVVVQTVGVHKNPAVTLELLPLGRGAQFGGAGLGERPLLLTRPPAEETKENRPQVRFQSAAALYQTPTLAFILHVGEVGDTRGVNLPLITHIDKQAQHDGGQDRHVGQDVAASTLVLWGEFGRPRGWTGLPFGHVLHVRPAGRITRLIQSRSRQNVQLLVCRQKMRRGGAWRQGRDLRICTAETHLGCSKFRPGMIPQEPE